MKSPARSSRPLPCIIETFVIKSFVFATTRAAAVTTRKSYVEKNLHRGGGGELIIRIVITGGYALIISHIGYYTRFTKFFVRATIFNIIIFMIKKKGRGLVALKK